MNEDLVEIYRGSGGPVRAEVIRSVLQDAGIEASVQGGGASSSYPVAVGALGEFSVWVRRADAEKAAKALEAAPAEEEDRG